MTEISTSVAVETSLTHYRCLKEHVIDRTTAHLIRLFVRINTCMEKNYLYTKDSIWHIWLLLQR